MAIYEYRNPETGEIVEIVQSVNDVHEYVKNGIKYERVFSKPNMSVDTSIDVFDAKGFERKTASKKGSVGDLWDSAKEASEKREKITGKDSMKEEYLSNYSKARRGKKLPKDLQK